MSIVETITNITNKKMITNSIAQAKHGELDLLVINHPTCKAAITLQGAQLLFWQPVSEKLPIIWLSDQTLFKKGTAIRGGVPICWPWFGKTAEPAHGFARIMDWQLSSYTENIDGVDLVLTLTSNEQTKHYIQADFELSLCVHVGTNCEIDLSCLGDVEATTALHSYFGVSDISSITVTGLGDAYQERLTTVNEPKIIGEMIFDQEVDRIYNSPQAEVLIKDTNRTIKITHKNQSDVVTWNPWSDRAKAIADLGDNEYLDFVCVETCRINKPIQSTITTPASYGVKIEVEQ